MINIGDYFIFRLRTTCTPNPPSGHPCEWYSPPLYPEPEEKTGLHSMLVRGEYMTLTGPELRRQIAVNQLEDSYQPLTTHFSAVTDL